MEKNNDDLPGSMENAKWLWGDTLLTDSVLEDPNSQVLEL